MSEEDDNLPDNHLLTLTNRQLHVNECQKLPKGLLVKQKHHKEAKHAEKTELLVDERKRKLDN